MKTFNEYVFGESALSEADAKPLKWAIDKKEENNILLKDGGKVVHRMFKYKSAGHEHCPYAVYVTKNSVNDCKNVKAMLDFVNHMVKTANFGKYSVPEMPKDVLAWLEK